MIGPNRVRSVQADTENQGLDESRGLFFVVRPAGRTCLEVKVLYSPGKGKS
jgi:hypothetical protein